MVSLCNILLLSCAEALIRIIISFITVTPIAMNDSSEAGTPLSDSMLQNDSRKGKTRTSINARQLEILQATYEKETRPSRPMREEIASQTGLSAKVIQVWFQNRRSKDKKDTTKGDSLMPPHKTEM